MRPIYGTAASRVGQATTYERQFPDPVRLAVANPEIGLEALDVIDAEDSLVKFIEMTWSILEPARPFVRGWAIDAICEHLEAVSSGEIRKLLINVPPGFMKSMSTCVFWPAWEWGPRKMPEMRYVCASYSHDLTMRDNRRCRQIITDNLFQKYWGNQVTIASDQDAKGKFENLRRGWKIATSVSGLGTGERGDRFIIDDPHNVKVAESERIRESTLQWFTEVVPTRVNDPDKSAFIVIMQRVHERDVSGLILSNELGYEYLCLPMEFEPDHPWRSTRFSDPRAENGELLWPERFSGRYLGELKAQLRSWGGSYAEAGQLQQRPSPRGGGMFKRKWWRFYETPGSSDSFYVARPHDCYEGPAEKRPDSFDWMLISVDAAFKKTTTGSRVSITCLAGRGTRVYILDNHTCAMTFSETCDNIATFDENDKEVIVGGMVYRWPEADRVLIEDKANGSAVIDTLRGRVPNLIAIEPAGGKESRASAIQPKLESGDVLLPDGAPWNEDIISEFAAFPVGAHDDQVDSVSQGVVYMIDNLDTLLAIAMSKM